MSIADWYNHTTYPGTSAALSSSAARSEFDAIMNGISAKLPDFSGNALKIVGVNAAATALTAVATTGTGSVVLATSPALVTPTLGVATVTTVNKVTLTAPATGSTLAIADGKTFTSSNTLTLTAVDGSTLAIGTGGTLGTAAYTAATAYLSSTGAVSPANGGTGVVNNAASTITITGSYASTFTLTGITGVTFPTSGTLAATSNKLSVFAATTSAELAGVISDETGSGALVFANTPTLVSPLLGTPTSGVLTNCSGTAASLTAGNVTTNANLTGDVTSVGNATTLTNAPVIAKVLTGYVSGSGTVAATDSILQAIQKLNGNDALRETSTNKDATGGYVGMTLFKHNFKNAANTFTSFLTNANTAARTYTFPDFDATMATVAGTETLTNKTLTSPTVNGGTHTAITSFGIRSTGAAFDLTMATSEVLTAGRTLTWVMGDAARTITLAGNLSYANSFTTSGNFAMTLTATASTSVTLPTTGTVLSTGVTATLTKGFTVTPNSLGNITNFTIDPTLGNYQYGTNHGAATWTAPTSDCSVDILLTNDASAGTVTFSGFTVSSNTGETLTTVNTSKFLVSIRRINAVSTYVIKALQ